MFARNQYIGCSRRVCVLGMILACLLSSVHGQVKTINLPHLEKRGNVTQLIVDGKPWLALAGELYNSTSSSMTYMEPIWPKLESMNLNTVLAVVSWQMVEAGKTPEAAKAEVHLTLYINLSKLISPINPFHHYWGHSSYSYPVNGYQDSSLITSHQQATATYEEFKVKILKSLLPQMLEEIIPRAIT